MCRGPDFRTIGGEESHLKGLRVMRVSLWVLPRVLPRVLVAVLTLVGVLLAAGTSASAARTGADPTSPTFNADSTCTVDAQGLIGDRWKALGGQPGPLGCPKAPERDAPGG